MFVRPVPISQDEIINVKQAAFKAGVSEKQIRKWCRLYGIGRQATPSSPMQISIVALEMRMNGDDEALELLRQNNRTHPLVALYADRVGIKA